MARSQITDVAGYVAFLLITNNAKPRRRVFRGAVEFVVVGISVAYVRRPLSEINCQPVNVAISAD